MTWVHDSSTTSPSSTKEEELKNVISDAEKNLGENEVRDAWRELLNYYANVGDEKLYLETFPKVYELTSGSLLKCDLLFDQALTAIQYRDFSLADRAIQRATRFQEEGSLDFDHKNRLMVFRAVLLLRSRKIREAAPLLLEVTQSFISTDLISFELYIRYVILTAPLVLTRPELKSKVLHSPEVLSVVSHPLVGDAYAFLHDLYDAKYGSSLATLDKVLIDVHKDDLFLSKHTAWLFKEVRLIAYKQHLSAFISVRLDSMAEQFGVDADVFARDLCKFITAGRLSCSIDGEKRVVVSGSQSVTKEGSVVRNIDGLLSKVQVVSRMMATV
ncbi:hypothetical protein P9112_014358 [Eukaryota sp. TZLM1-RC]